MSLFRVQYRKFNVDDHPEYYYETINIRTDSGEDILLSDLIEDKKGLDSLLIKKLKEEYPEADFFKLENTFEAFTTDSTEAENEEEKVYCFTISDNGLTFYFAPEDVASYESGSQIIDLSVDEISGLMKKDNLLAW